MTRATPSDLLAEYWRVQERFRTWQIIASWLADYQERVRAAVERFEASAGLVEMNGNGRFDTDPFELDELLNEWAHLRLCIRLAKERRHD